MNEEIIIRKATIEDVGFLVDTIVAAEKSGTDNFGLAKLFDLSEGEMREYIKAMLDEEIDGCEFSVSSFIVAESRGQVVAAFAGWIEGQNEDGLPSALLKSNLISYCLPMASIMNSRSRSEIVRPLQIERENGAYQLEYSYTKPGFRGKGIIGRIIDEHETEARSRGVNKIQVHVFDNNPSAIKSYNKKGFRVVHRFESNHPETSLYFPSRVELLMEKCLTINTSNYEQK